MGQQLVPHGIKVMPPVFITKGFGNANSCFSAFKVFVVARLWLTAHICFWRQLNHLFKTTVSSRWPNFRIIINNSISILYYSLIQNNKSLFFFQWLKAFLSAPSSQMTNHYRNDPIWEIISWNFRNEQLSFYLTVAWWHASERRIFYQTTTRRH